MQAQRPEEGDPYAPPPMHHDKSGAIVRIAMVAALLGAAAWGYASFASHSEQTALAPEVMQEQTLADASYSAPPIPMPTTDAETPAPAPAAAPARAPRRSAPAVEQAPTPEAAPTPQPAYVPPTPAPLPPVDMPPATGD